MLATNDAMTPEVWADQIFEMSGVRFEPEAAAALWPRILQHKWLMSEKLGRDVGFRVACIDFLENMELADREYLAYKRQDTLDELGARSISREVWDGIADSQPPKQIVQRKIILPLTRPDLSTKHGVVPPKAIIFFGPPGTGKTHFAKAIAGILAWWFIEIAPSMLLVDGTAKMGANLRAIMEKVRTLDEAVIFIDEFEELAGRRDEADRLDKSVTNEFLKQVPLLKSESKNLLLVCATNYIRQLDDALLRPGRFDCIIPVGGLNEDERATIVQHYLNKVNAGEVDLNLLVKMTGRFTPADLEYLFQQVAQYAFEQELATGTDYKVTTATILEIIPKIRPTLTEEIITEFEKDSLTYARF